MKSSRLAFAAIPFFLSWPSIGDAQTSFRGLSAECDVAVIATIRAAEYVWASGEDVSKATFETSYPSNRYTKFQFTAIELLQNRTAQSVTHAYFYGGVNPDGTIITRSHYPQLNVWNRYLLFLKQHDRFPILKPCGAPSISLETSVFTIIERDGEELAIPYLVQYQVHRTSSRRNEFSVDQPIIVPGKANLIPVSDISAALKADSD